MSMTPVYAPIGQTTALSVAGTSHSAVTIGPIPGDSMLYASFLNTGSTTVFVTIAASSAPASTVITDGNAANEIVLPPGMTQPIVYRVPPNTFSVTAIGSAAGPSLVYITPVAPV